MTTKEIRAEIIKLLQAKVTEAKVHTESYNKLMTEPNGKIVVQYSGSSFGDFIQGIVTTVESTETLTFTVILILRDLFEEDSILELKDKIISTLQGSINKDNNEYLRITPRGCRTEELIPGYAELTDKWIFGLKMDFTVENKIFTPTN